ncbi:MAG TPA: hypothetical protein VM616_06315 [Gammaproteobacteria bacterium]|nr:hypothetical protein [Gammaproteobacteria bacterium]
MKQRGRKSAAQLAVTPLGPRIGRPKPPECLTDEQKAEWTTVVAAMPADWFGRESLGVLVEYCRHVSRGRFLASRLDAMKMEDTDEIPVWDKLAAAAERETRAMLACARALRLTHQAKYDAVKAARKAGNEYPGPKPWERFPGDRRI